jgi:hypothetical protein
MKVRYDFDKDGFITKEDVALILSYAPIEKSTTKSANREGQYTLVGGGGEEYADRAESQKELTQLVEVAFNTKPKLSLDDFKQVAELVTSEMFLCIFSLIKTCFPSYTQFRHYEQGLKKKGEQSPVPSSGKKFAPPKVLSKFSPLSQLVRCSTPKLESKALRIPKTNEAESIEESKGMLAQKPYLSKLAPRPKSRFGPGSEIPDSPIGPAVRLPTAKTRTPSTFQASTPEQILFCECGKEITDVSKLQCDDCLNNLDQYKLEGYLMKKGKKTVKKLWLSIDKRELYSKRRSNQ